MTMTTTTTTWLLMLLPFILGAFCPGADSTLTAAVWGNGAFAPEAAARVSVVPDASLAGLELAAYATVRLMGTLTPSVTDAALNFTIESDGLVRLWVDNHLLLVVPGSPAANGTALFSSFMLLPVVAGVPLAFRLEYSRQAPNSTRLPVLAVGWAGSATPAGPVPPLAFSAVVSAAEQAKLALRDRLVSPLGCPWQTYYRPNAAAHVLMPAGFFMDISLADVSTGGGGALLTNLIVMNREGPYLARAGLHSRNGSDYTQFAVWAWRGLDCNVSIETTVLETGMLLFLASATGASCSSLQLLAQPALLEERAGWPLTQPPPSPAGFAMVLPGFPTVYVAPMGASAGAASRPANVAATAAAAGFALALEDGARVGYCAQAGSPIAAAGCPDVDATVVPALAAARVRAAQALDRYGDALRDVADGITASVLWNTIFTPYQSEGVVSIVSRSSNWAQFGTDADEYVLFCWDSYLIAMQAAMEPGTLRDIGWSTLLAVTLGRTARGFVPNWKSGGHATFDRSENQIGAMATRVIFDRWASPSGSDTWVLELLFPALLSWHEWVWTARTAAGGVLAGAALMTQGSDPWGPEIQTPHDHGMGTLQGARYESMDNSPLYDSPPLVFNSTTHRMELYDVSPTALFLSDAEALVHLAPLAGRSDVVPAVQARFDAAAAALNAHLWQPAAGMYTNRLFNGSFVPRYAPPSYFPLISGAASDAQAAAAAVMLASPVGFCVNASHLPGSPAMEAVPLTNWWTPRLQRTTGCGTLACTRAVLDGKLALFQTIEATVPSATAVVAGAVALNTYVRGGSGGLDTVLATAPPGANYTLERQEAWCFDSAAVPPAAASWPLTNLTLWFAPASGDHRTCGTSACEASAAAAGYVVQGLPMCLAFDASTPATQPCLVPLPSVARSDPAFADQDYWRGRAWAPHTLLVYLGLLRYDHLPALRTARADLVALGASTMLREWLAFGHIGENFNAYIGVTQDSGDADPWYAWGGTFGLPALLEAGF